MEFFDFERASGAGDGHDELHAEIGSPSGQPDPIPATEDSFPLLPDDFNGAAPLGVSALMPGAPAEVGSFAHFPTWIPRISIPSSPCEYCRSRQLECLVMYDGRTSCSSCIALARSCSFARPQPDAVEEAPRAPGPGVVHGVEAEDGGTRGRPKGERPLGAGDDQAKHDEGPARPDRTRFSREAIRTLKDWLAAHADHPYPTMEEKDQLKAATGLKRSQISTWLNNARRRGKVRSKWGSSPSVTGSMMASPAGAIEIASRRPGAPSLHDMDPLERWQHSPPEHEPASMSAISNAVARSPYVAAANGASSSSGSWRDAAPDSSAESSFSLFRAPSLTSVETKRSTGSSSNVSLASALSHPSQHSRGSMESRTRAGTGTRPDRRRRRRPGPSWNAPEREPVRQYQCTFCTDSFKTKYDWQRHEKSLHLSLERWTCAPHGGAIEVDGIARCVYCGAADVSAAHLERHHHRTCQGKPVAERTFYRHDHLRQHLRLTHACALDRGRTDGWKTRAEQVRSRCGFCGAACTTWPGRVEHLAGHFRDGAQMADWKGDWGFEAAVRDLVDNAMPPWHIDHERRTPIPFSATGLVSAAAHLSLDPAPPGHHHHHPPLTPSLATIPPRLHCDAPPGLAAIAGDGYEYADSRICFQELERMLSRWALAHQPARLTDDMLQAEARQIVYMCTDAWNQTLADDPLWLAIFRQRYGLPSDADGREPGALVPHESAPVPMPLVIESGAVGP
ncbi:MAG: hypothetical protein M1826_002134 [Phylliscum demangeonii]|nr:MAG: hypothetical protein M1826_002134 [Phylliscum demangeonii]